MLLKKLLTLLFMTAIFAQTTDAAVIFVNQSATGANNGTTWTDAYNWLDDALANASPGDEVWVARGTYHSRRDRNYALTLFSPFATFNIPSGVAVYGGFIGTETQRCERDYDASPTTLTGDAMGNDGGTNTPANPLYDDNHYHVVTMENVNNSTKLDGFTITSGKADQSYIFSIQDNYSNGAGITIIGGSAPYIRNCIIKNCFATGYGAGAYAMAGNLLHASPIFRNCLFRNNFATRGGGITFASGSGGNFFGAIEDCDFLNNVGRGYGGAIVLNGDKGSIQPIIFNCEFRSNGSRLGGAMVIEANNGNAFPTISNGLFWNNTSNMRGSAVSIHSRTNSTVEPDFIHCTFNRNTVNGPTGYGVLSAEHDPGSTINAGIYNSILWDNNGNGDNWAVSGTGANVNFDIAYSIVSSAQPFFTCPPNASCGSQVYQEDPEFVNSASGDLHLSNPSNFFSVNVADASYTPTYVTTDLDNYLRFDGYQMKAELGCYELKECAPNIIYVNADANGDNTGISWEHAFTDLQDAIAYANFYNTTAICNIQPTIYVAEGTYYPTNTSDRNISFELPLHIEMYGGFPNPVCFSGGNPGMNDRDWNTFETKLSGNIGGKTTSDNSYHVVSTGYLDGSNPATVTAIFDGFIVRDGNANGSLSNQQVGGGMYFEQTSFQSWLTPGPIFRNCKILRNASAGDGSGVYVASDVSNSPGITFENCQFESNQSGGNGAFKIESDEANTYNFSNCTFISNVSSGNGGAIASETESFGDYINILSCTFENNSTPGKGGAFWFGSNQQFGFHNITVEQSTFSNNSANINGGVFSLEGVDDIIFESNNNLFYSNSTLGEGGLFYNNSYSDNINTFDFRNCTAYDHEASDGGVFYFEDSDLDELNIYNCIFRNMNTTGPSGKTFIYVDPNVGGSSPWIDIDLRYNNIESTGCSDASAFEIPFWATINCSNNQWNQNPQFMNTTTGNENFRLNIGASPCIDAGANTLSAGTTDIAGNPRVINNAVDMGCYENFAGMMRPNTTWVQICHENLKNKKKPNKVILVPKGSKQEAIHIGHGDTYGRCLNPIGPPGEGPLKRNNSGFDNEAMSLDKYNVNPNPFHQTTTIEIPAEMLANHNDVQIRVVNLLGKTVHQVKQISESRIILNMEDLVPGIYLYRLHADGKQLATGKLILQ